MRGLKRIPDIVGCLSQVDKRKTCWSLLLIIFRQEDVRLQDSWQLKVLSQKDEMDSLLGRNSFVESQFLSSETLGEGFEDFEESN